MQNDILVSIITVCYNSEATVEDTVKSVLSQSYTNWEHIIVDGGSTDRTVEIIKSYQKQYGERLRVYVGPDKGIYDAMNKGIGYAKGEVIGIINSDDWYEPDALSEVIEKYLKCGDRMAIMSGGVNRINGGVILYTQHFKHVSGSDFKRNLPLQHPGVFVSKSVYESLGGFDLTFRVAADYDFLWRCYDSNRVIFILLDNVVSNMREGGASDVFSIKGIYRIAKERQRIISKHCNSLESIWFPFVFFNKEVVTQLIKSIMGSKQLHSLYRRFNKTIISQ